MSSTTPTSRPDRGPRRRRAPCTLSLPLLSLRGAPLLCCSPCSFLFHLVVIPLSSCVPHPLASSLDLGRCRARAERVRRCGSEADRLIASCRRIGSIRAPHSRARAGEQQQGARTRHCHTTPRRRDASNNSAHPAEIRRERESLRSASWSPGLRCSSQRCTAITSTAVTAHHIAPHLPIHDRLCSLRAAPAASTSTGADGIHIRLLAQ